MPGTKKAIGISLSATLIAGMFGLTGCGTKDNVHTNSTTSTSNRYKIQSSHTDGLNRFGVKSNGTDGMRLNGHSHMMENMRVDKNLSNRISQMSDVRSATVLVNDRTAYVAVVLKNTGTKGNTMKSKSMGRSTDMGGMGVHGTDTSRGSYTTDGTAPGVTGLGHGMDGHSTAADRSNTANNQGLYGTMGTGTYGMMRGMTDSGRTGMNSSTDRTGSMGTNSLHGNSYHNYAAQEEMPAEVKSRIANKVKQFAPQIEQVYVSANPDFLQQVKNLGTHMENGHPIKGLTADFQNMVERIFPTRSDTMTTPNGNRTMDNNRGMAPMNNTNY